MLEEMIRHVRISLVHMHALCEIHRAAHLGQSRCPLQDVMVQ